MIPCDPTRELSFFYHCCHHIYPRWYPPQIARASSFLRVQKLYGGHHRECKLLWEKIPVDTASCHKATAIIRSYHHSLARHIKMSISEHQG